MTDMGEKMKGVKKTGWNNRKKKKREKGKKPIGEAATFQQKLGLRGGGVVYDSFW